MKSVEFKFSVSTDVYVFVWQLCDPCSVRSRYFFISACSYWNAYVSNAHPIQVGLKQVYGAGSLTTLKGDIWPAYEFWAHNIRSKEEHSSETWTRTSTADVTETQRIRVKGVLSRQSGGMETGSCAAGSVFAPFSAHSVSSRGHYETACYGAFMQRPDIRNSVSRLEIAVSASEETNWRTQ